MNRARFLAAFLAASSVVAHAQTTDPRVRTDLASYPDSVTISQTANIATTPVTYVTFVVTFTNGGGSDVNQLLITGSTSVSANLTAAKIATADAATPPNVLLYPGCTLPTPTSISCNFYSLNPIPPGGTFNFPVIVEVPQYLNSSPLTGQFITLTTQATFREGKAGDTASPNSLGVYNSSLTTPVDAQSATSVKSAIVKGGGNVFTGNKDLPTTADPQATSVAFDALTKLTDASLTFIKTEVREFVDTTKQAQCDNTKTFKLCVQTQLKAQDQKDNHVRYAQTLGGKLSQVISAHPSNLRNGAKPEEFVWWYVSDLGNVWPINLNPKSDFCPKDLNGFPAANYNGIPCLASLPRCYKSKDPEVIANPALNGVCKWTFLNDGNGLIRSFN